MADVCLVSMPILGRAKSTIVPHWILWLSGYIEKQGFSVDVVDVKSDVNEKPCEVEKQRVFQETVERAVASQSAFIGLSAFTEDYQSVMKLAGAIKQRSSAKIVIGGIHATVAPEDYFIHTDSPVDIAVVGDGEIPLTNLIAAEKKGIKSWETINGLVFRKGADIIRTAPQLVSPPLDNVPLHPYHKLDMNFYLQPQQFLLRSIYLSGLHVFTSRGCPYGCTFCANSRKQVRFRPLDSVIEELRYLKETYRIDGFYIHDDTFAIKSSRVIEFCEKLSALNYKFVWGMEGRVNEFPDSMFRTLTQSGCIQIDFGVESGSQASLDRMKKGTRVEDAEEVFRRCNKEKIRTYANFMINTPEETEDDLRKTVELMEKIEATSYGICITTPYPGTEIYERYVKPPLTVDEYQLYNDYKTYIKIVDSRFHLAAHDLDIEAVTAKLYRQFMVAKGWQIISLHPSYVRAILTSKRKMQYFRVFMYRFIRKFKNLIS